MKFFVVFAAILAVAVAAPPAGSAAPAASAGAGILGGQALTGVVKDVNGIVGGVSTTAGGLLKNVSGVVGNLTKTVNDLINNLLGSIINAVLCLLEELGIHLRPQLVDVLST